MLVFGRSPAEVSAHPSRSRPYVGYFFATPERGEADEQRDLQQQVVDQQRDQ